MPLDIVRCRTLQATIWDCDRFQENMFLGAVTIPLADLQANQEVTKWYPLTNYNRIWRSNSIKTVIIMCDYLETLLKKMYTVCIYNYLFSNKCFFFFPLKKSSIEKIHFEYWSQNCLVSQIRLVFALGRDWCGPALNWSSMRLRHCLCF